jgi:hypothetical protein
VAGTARDDRAAEYSCDSQVVVRYEEGGDEIESVIQTFTQHAFRVGDAWRWILNAQTIENAQNDMC